MLRNFFASARPSSASSIAASRGVFTAMGASNSLGFASRPVDFKMDSMLRPSASYVMTRSPHSTFRFKILISRGPRRASRES